MITFYKYFIVYTESEGCEFKARSCRDKRSMTRNVKELEKEGYHYIVETKVLIDHDNFGRKT